MTERTPLPLIATNATPKILITNDDIADVFDVEDLERFTNP